MCICVAGALRLTRVFQFIVRTACHAASVCEPFDTCALCFCTNISLLFARVIQFISLFGDTHSDSTHAIALAVDDGFGMVNRHLIVCEFAFDVFE